MNKKITVSMLVLLSFLLIPNSPVRADEESSSNEAKANASLEVKLEREKKSEEMKKKLDDKRRELEDKKIQVKTNIEDRKNSTSTGSTTRREDRKDDRSEDREDRQDDRRQNVEARIKNHVEWMTKRFNAAVERLEKLATRIDSRIAKIKAEGGNTAEAEASVAIARTEIIQAKAGIAKIPTELTNALATTTIKGNFGPLNSLAKNIKEDTKAAHSALVDAISKLKVGVNATTSTTVQ